MPRAAPRAPKIPAPAPLPCPPDWPIMAANIPPPSITASPTKMQPTPPINSRIAMTVTPPGLFIRLLLCYYCRVLYPHFLRLQPINFRKETSFSPLQVPGHDIVCHQSTISEATFAFAAMPAQIHGPATSH